MLTQSYIVMWRHLAKISLVFLREYVVLISGDISRQIFSENVKIEIKQMLAYNS